MPSEVRGDSERVAHECLAEELELFDPLVHPRLDGSHVARAGDGLDVDVAVVQQHLDVVREAEDEDVLVVLVRQHGELTRLPVVLHLHTAYTEVHRGPTTLCSPPAHSVHRVPTTLCSSPAHSVHRGPTTLRGSKNKQRTV